MLNGWGDRAGCTKMAIRTVDVAATRMRTLDPAGLRRNLYKVHSDVFEREEVHLIEYPDAHLWYLVCAQKDAGTSVVPLFPSELFAPNSGGVIVTRYGVAMREVIARGDVDEMRAEAERVREALADFDGPRKRMAGVRVDDDNVREVREALDELQKALAEIED
jgi:hypothetical protein